MLPLLTSCTDVDVFRDAAPTQPPQPGLTTASEAPQMSLEETIEHAKRAFALKKYEQAVEHYASALELV